jgi:hypothetical protein
MDFNPEKAFSCRSFPDSLFGLAAQRRVQAARGPRARVRRGLRGQGRGLQLRGAGGRPRRPRASGSLHWRAE